MHSVHRIVFLLGYTHFTVIFFSFVHFLQFLSLFFCMNLFEYCHSFECNRACEGGGEIIFSSGGWVSSLQELVSQGSQEYLTWKVGGGGGS